MTQLLQKSEFEQLLLFNLSTKAQTRKQCSVLSGRIQKGRWYIWKNWNRQRRKNAFCGGYNFRKYDALRLWCRHEMRTNLIALYRSLSYCQWGDTNRSDPPPVRFSGYFQALSNSWTRDYPEQIRGVARTGIISGLRGFHVHLKPHSCSPYLAWSWRIVKTNRAFL